MSSIEDDFSDQTDDPQAQRESRELMGLLNQQRDRLGCGRRYSNRVTSSIKKILGEARTRSQEIRDAATLLS